MAFWVPAALTVLGFLDISPHSQAAVVGFSLVAVLAAVLAWVTFRSYQATQNWRLLFVMTAFVVFFLQAILFVWNEIHVPHPIDHDMVLTVAAIFNLIIMLLLVIPFFARAGR